jgi:DNA-binding NtrC family response regulator
MNPPRVRNVLIVDDDQGLRELSQRCLKKCACRVSTAGTLAEARALLSHTCFDLIIIDYHLAENMTGLDFYDELRARGSNMPAIMCTGFSDEEHLAEARRHGLTTIIFKSDTYLDDLPAAVLEALDSSGE